MWLMVVLGARLGALPWGCAPILDPLHGRANLVCSPNVINSRVAALNRNCQLRAWGRAGTSSEAALRARCAVEQPMRLGPHLPCLSPCARDGCLVGCHRIHTASCSSNSSAPGDRCILSRSSRGAACDERHRCHGAWTAHSAGSRDPHNDQNNV